MKKYTICLFAFLFSTAYSFAQVARNSTEQISNKQEVATSKAQLDRDLKELADFKAHARQFELAVNQADLFKANTQLRLLTADMLREINQSEAKIKADQAEVAKSQAEVSSNRWEIGRNRADARRTKWDRRDDVQDQARDRANQADDRRDLNDDQADRNEQMFRLQRQKDIYQVFVALNLSDRSNLTKAKTNIHLLTEFEQSMEADIAETREELGEDRTETSEDRRERRDDRKERREKGRW